MISTLPQLLSDHSSTVDQKKRYAELAAKIMEAAKGLKREEITIFQQSFYPQEEKVFTFYYGEKEGQARLIPIPRSVIGILNKQIAEKGECNWPVKNPETGEYFVPVFSAAVPIPPESIFETTEHFLENALQMAKNDKTSREYKILEALPPYARKIHDLLSQRYNELLKLFPGQYPEIKD